jgi:predicted  nucleic acid-binding Zn-ribbon protein
MLKRSAFIVVALTLVGIAFTFQNCGRAEFSDPQNANLIYSENNDTTAGALAADPALLAEVCLSLGGIYDANSTPPCIIDYFDSIAMDELSERICVQLGGVWDANRVPECALPFVLRDEFLNAIINIQNQINSLQSQLDQINTINMRLDDLQNQINNIPGGLSQEDLDNALSPILIQLSQLQMQFDTLDLTGFISQSDLDAALLSVNQQITALTDQISNLQSATDQNTQDIININSQIELLQSDIMSLTNNYSALLLQFNSLVTTVNSFQTELQNIQDNMATQSDLQAVSDNLTSLYNDLSNRINVFENMNLIDSTALDQALTPLMAQINLILLDIQDLANNKVDNTTFEMAINNLDSQLNQLTLNLQALTGNVNDNTTVINAIISQLSLIESRLMSLESNDQNQDQAIAQLQSDLMTQISALEEWLSNLDDSQNTQNQQITNILNQLQSLQSQLNNNAQDIGTLASQFADLMGQLMTINTELDAIQEQVDENSQAILNLVSRINLLDANLEAVIENGVTQEDLQVVVDSLNNDIAGLIDRLNIVDQTLLVQGQSITDIQLELEEIRNLINDNGSTTNNFIVIINLHGSRLRQILSLLLPVIQSSGDISSILDQFYRLYNNMDRNACQAIGGNYDANRNPKCQLNMYNKLDLRKLTNQSCVQKDNHELSVSCEPGFELIGCAGFPGTINGGGHQIKANYHQDSCTLKIDHAACVPGQQETQQNVVAVCGRWIGGTQCDANHVWNADQNRCVPISCPHGMYLSNGRCKPKTSCANNEIKVFGRCVKKPSFKGCRQPQENKCSSLLSMPSGFPLSCDCDDWTYLKERGYCEEN